MLIEPSKQEVTITLDLLVKIKGTSTSLKFLGGPIGVEHVKKALKR